MKQKMSKAQHFHCNTSFCKMFAAKNAQLLTEQECLFQSWTIRITVCVTPWQSWLSCTRCITSAANTRTRVNQMKQSEHAVNADGSQLGSCPQGVFGNMWREWQALDHDGFCNSCCNKCKISFFFLTVCALKWEELELADTCSQATSTIQQQHLFPAGNSLGGGADERQVPSKWSNRSRFRSFFKKREAAGTLPFLRFLNHLISQLNLQPLSLVP